MILSCSLLQKKTSRFIFLAVANPEGGEQKDVPQKAPEASDTRPLDVQIAEKKGQIDALVQQIDDPNGPYAALGEKARQDLVGRLKSESLDLRAATDQDKEAALREADRVLQEISTGLQTDLLQIVDRAKKRKDTARERENVDPALKAERIRLAGDMRQFAQRNAWSGVEDRYSELVKLARKGLPMTADDHYLGYQAAKARGDEKTAEKRLALSVDPTKLPEPTPDPKPEESKPPEPPHDARPVDAPDAPKSERTERAPRGPTAKISRPQDTWERPKNTPLPAGEVDPLLKSKYDNASKEADQFADRGAWNGVEDQWKILDGLAQKGVPLSANDYFLGSRAALNGGDLVEARNRARNGLVAHPTDSTLLAERDVYENGFGPVALRYKGDAGLTPDVMPFPPQERMAITAAQEQLQNGGQFTGLLPVGDYTIGTMAFTVTKDQVAVRDSDAKKETRSV